MTAAWTFYYTNQQSARLMFYHDHAWGITRLNVYAGEAAGYLISDDTEKRLMHVNTGLGDPVPTGPLATVGLGIPLVVQDRTFVPDAAAARRGRTRPGTRPAGAATAASGTTTSTCRRRTPATPAA